MGKKSYDNREKFRCVLRGVFDPVYAYMKKIDDLISKGLSNPQAVALAGTAPAAMTDVAMIQRGIDYTFDTSRRGRYVENRFNTKDFSALYTADCVETAISERLHHWPSCSGQDPAYTLFSVSYTGDARDLRPDFSSGKAVFPDRYSECQAYARDALDSGLTGLVAPSKRRKSGSCCVLFAESCIESGHVVGKGMFTH